MTITNEERDTRKRTLVVTFELETHAGQASPSGEEIAEYLNDKLANPKDTWELSKPTVFTRAPVVVANISGGVLQGSFSEIPNGLIALDFEVDEATFPVPQDDGSTCNAEVSTDMCERDPDWVKEVGQALLQFKAKE
jgi:hypothetical protein